MNRTKVFVIAGVIFLIFLGIAVLFDATKTISSASEAVCEVDRELRRQEERFITSVTSFPTRSGALERAMTKHKQATSMDTRHEAFEELSSLVNRELLASADSNNPLMRRLMDELNGAINRRKVAAEDLEPRIQEFNRVQKSFQGSLARFVMDTTISCS